MLWAIFAVLTIAVVLVLLLPVLRGDGAKADARTAYDMVVYRDQLAEIEREIESGVLPVEQADAARTEIHRRMLAAEDAELAKRPLTAPGRQSQLVAVLTIALAVPVGAAALYGILGSPRIAGAPYAWRQAHDPGLAASASAEQLARLLQSTPSAAGYRRLAGMYFSAREFDKAAAADRQALALGAQGSDVWSEYGEALAMSAGGAIVPEALMAFAKSLAQDPHDFRARFYIGLAEAQIGKARTAVAIWRDLLASAPVDAGWRGMVESNINSVAKDGGFTPASVQPQPPSLEALNAAVGGMMSAMAARGSNPPPATAPSTPPAEADSPAPLDPNSPQMTMIRGMVERLAQRMEANPDDVAGWQRLAHAYVVLGDKAKARAAIAHAVKLKPNDPSVQAGLAETR